MIPAERTERPAVVIMRVPARPRARCEQQVSSSAAPPFTAWSGTQGTLPHRTAHHRRGRPTQNQRPRTAPRLVRPLRPRPDPDRHAGFDRQLARYPQLYSRIGFAHQYKPLDTEDIPAVLAQYWQQLGPPDSDVDPDTEVVGTIVRITGGNFRLIDRPRRTRGPGSPCRPWQNDRSEQVMKQEKSPGG